MDLLYAISPRRGQALFFHPFTLADCLGLSTVPDLGNYATDSGEASGGLETVTSPITEAFFEDLRLEWRCKNRRPPATTPSQNSSEPHPLTCGGSPAAKICWV
jgi:hypothetical protein